MKQIKGEKNKIKNMLIPKLKKTIAEHKAFFVATGDHIIGLVVVDEYGKITRINRGFEALTLWKEKEVIGKFLIKIVPREDESGHRIPFKERILSRVLSGKIITTTTTTDIPIIIEKLSIFYYIKKDKSRFPVNSVISPILLDGKIRGAVEVFYDITKEKEIDKAKNEFISLASHQLKNPPTAIKLLTERILNEEVGKITRKQREYLKDIRYSNQRMIDIVNTLLDVSHIELGTFNIELKKKNICVIVQNILHDLKPVFNKKQLKLKEVYQENGRMVSIDESSFRMIINNLVINAINYTPKRGSIKVECREINKGKMLGGKLLDENSLAIIITDTGYGIPKNQQSRLFTKFFRTDNIRQKHPDGTGLGLYIVKSILNNSGGLVWFSSKENKGSTFYVTIPITGMRSDIK